MKHLTRTLIFIFVLATLLLSACAGAAAPASNSAADKVQADLVEFTGVIEAINGTQWTINGQVVTIDPSVIRDGPFQVGDTVKLEAQVAQDGSVVVTRVETPSASAADSGNTNSADDGNSNSNSNANSNSNSNSNDNSSAPDPTTGGLVFDDGGNEAFGSVDSMTADAIVIGGQAFALTNGSEFKNLIATGDFVKVHFVLNADGTYTIVEIETWDPAAVSNGNSNSNSNSNDDNSNGNSNGNSNDDDDDNSNGNSNDDDDDDDNGNDNGDDDDDDDDNGNDDNSNGNG